MNDDRPASGFGAVAAFVLIGGIVVFACMLGLAWTAGSLDSVR